MRKKLAVVIPMLLLGGALAVQAEPIRMDMENEESITGVNARLLGGSFTEGVPAMTTITGSNRGLALGGAKEGIKLSNYTLPNTGSFSCYVKRTEKLVPGTTMTFLSSLGTLPYYNFISLAVTLKEGSSGTINVNFIGAQGVPNTATRLKGSIGMDPGEWVHVALTWCNLNSGKADASGALYVNGEVVDSFKNRQVTIPAPATEVYVGSTTLDRWHENKCGAGAFVMDEVVLQDTMLSAEEVKAQAAKLGLRTSFVDGKSLPHLPIMGGGQNQYRTVPLPDFPAQNGAVFCKVKLAKMLPGKGVTVFNACATPNWHNRFALLLKMKENNQVFISGMIVGAPSKIVNTRKIETTVPWDPEKEHTLLMTWKNVSSGSANMDVTIWYDGASVATLKNGESRMNKAPESIRIGGENPPSGGWSEKDLLTVSDFRIWNGEVPENEMNELFQSEQPETAPETTSNLPKLPAAPAVEGAIQPGLWNQFAGMGLLHDFHRNGLAMANTDIRAAYDNDHLYFIWKAKFDGVAPSGQRHGKRDAELWQKDSVEFVIKTASGRFHYIVSPYGDIFDRKDADVTWNTQAAYAVKIGSGEWTGILSIPMSELEVAGGTELQGSVYRNAGSLQSDTGSWSAANYEKLGTWTFAPADVVFNQVVLPRKIIAGKNSGTVSVRNLTAKNTAAEIILTIGQGEDARMTKVRRNLPAHTPNADLTFEFLAAREGEQPYSLQVRDAAGKTVFSNSGFLAVIPALYVTTTPTFYKGYMDVTVDAGKLQNAEDHGTVQIMQDEKSFGEPLPFTLKDGKATVRMSTKDLPATGVYQVRTQLKKDGKAFAASTDFDFAARPAVIDPNAGRKIYFGDGWFPPVYKDGSVSVWNRTYTWKQSFFPASVISNGQDLFTGTPYFEYVTNGQTKRLSAASVTFTGSDEEKCTFTVKGADDALQIAADVRVEYDGFIGYRMTLEPRNGKKITRLTMVFPMAAENMQYKLAGLETTFTKKRTYIPEYPAAGCGFPFAHMAGVGCGDRAFFFVCESDQGWLPYDRDDVEQIIPGKKTVEWRWNVVNGAPMQKIAAMECGFQVTPYKKLREGYPSEVRIGTIWPGGLSHFSGPAYQLKNIKASKALGANVLCLFSFWSKHFNGIEPDDPELFREYVKAAHAEGMKVILYRACITNPQEPSFVHFGKFWQSLPAGAFFGRDVDPATKRISMGRCPQAPEYNDWYVGGCKYLMEEYGVDGFYYDFGEPHCNNALHGCGYPGENTTMHSGASTDTIGINLGELTEADKARRPTSAVIAQRELWKRMYNMVKEVRGEEGIIDAHTSDPARVASTPFVDTLLVAESGACRHVTFMETPDMFRYYYSKEFLGTMGSPIIYADSGPDPKAENRFLLAMGMLHRSPFRFETGKWQMPGKDLDTTTCAKIWKILQKFDVGSAEWLPYYSQKAVTVDNADDLMKVSLWKRSDRVLMVVANLNKEPRRMTLHLDPAFDGFQQAVNAENGQPVERKDRCITVDLPKCDCILIELQ